VTENVKRLICVDEFRDLQEICGSIEITSGRTASGNSGEIQWKFSNLARFFLGG
jgi:hypothetical protein